MLLVIPDWGSQHFVMYYVYILLCGDNSFYTGITNDLERRFREHRDKKGGHYTNAHAVKKILYAEKHTTRSKALKREAEIKTWPRWKKLKLIKK